MLSEASNSTLISLCSEPLDSHKGREFSLKQPLPQLVNLCLWLNVEKVLKRHIDATTQGTELPFHLETSSRFKMLQGAVGKDCKYSTHLKRWWFNFFGGNFSSSDTSSYFQFYRSVWVWFSVIFMSLKTSCLTSTHSASFQLYMTFQNHAVVRVRLRLGIKLLLKQLFLIASGHCVWHSFYRTVRANHKSYTKPAKHRTSFTKANNPWTTCQTLVKNYIYVSIQYTQTTIWIRTWSTEYSLMYQWKPSVAVKGNSLQ